MLACSAIAARALGWTDTADDSGADATLMQLRADSSAIFAAAVDAVAPEQLVRSAVTVRER